MIDNKYKELVLTIETSTVNILNMNTGTIIKIADVPDLSSFLYFVSDSTMCLIEKSKVDSFSFVIIGIEEILKFEVKKSLLDLCLVA